MFKGLIFGVMLSTYILGPDGHLTLSGDAVPITQPDNGNYFETQVETEPVTEESHEETSEAETENTPHVALFDEEQYQDYECWFLHCNRQVFYR